MTERRNKYNARRTVVAGRTFDSAAEARRYETLVLRERLGVIRDLRCQVPIPLVINGVDCGVYKADFVYEDALSGYKVYEDVKSPATRTATYRLKAKVVRALYGINVREVSA